jgi:hypothetical protein
MSERLSGGDLWDKETKPDEDFRLLAKKPGFQRDDYVDFPGRAVKEEGEAVTEPEQVEISRESSNRFEVMRAEELHRREGRSMAAQVRELYDLARKTGQDVPEIRQAIEDAKKRLKEAA